MPCYCYGSTDLYSVSDAQHASNAKVSWMPPPPWRSPDVLPLPRLHCKRADVSLPPSPPAPQGLRWKLSKQYGVAVPSYSGLFGFLPKRVPNDLVFGEPLELACAKKGEPTDAEVQAAHAAYVGALKKLFDAHKAEFGFGDRELVVG